MFFDGGRHADGGYSIRVMRVLTFLSPPNFSSYSWRICILCFVPVTMTSSSTSSEGMDRSKSILAKADATLTFREDADAVVVPHFLAKQSVVVNIGALFLMKSFLCTLSLIFCSNEHDVHVGFGGKFGHGLHINSKQGERSDSDRYKKPQ